MGLTKLERRVCTYLISALEDRKGLSKEAFDYIIGNAEWEKFHIAAAEKAPEACAPKFEKISRECKIHMEEKSQESEHENDVAEESEARTEMSRKKRKMISTYNLQNAMTDTRFHPRKKVKGMTNHNDANGLPACERDVSSECEDAADSHVSARGQPLADNGLPTYSEATNAGSRSTSEPDFDNNDKPCMERHRLTSSDSRSESAPLSSTSVHDPDGLEDSTEEEIIEEKLFAGDRGTFLRLQNTYRRESRKSNPRQPVSVSLDEDVFYTIRNLSLQERGKWLVRFLNKRPEATSSKTAEAPRTWNMQDAKEVFSTIEGIHGQSVHWKLHKVFAQMRLYEIIESECHNKAFLATHKSDSHMKDHMKYIESMARTRHPDYQGESLRDAKKEIENGYNAGRRWSMICEAFSGSGAVLLFVTARIAPSYIASQWMEFKRGLLAHSASYLPTIKELVVKLGPNALQHYCEHNNLPREVRNLLGNVDES